MANSCSASVPDFSNAFNYCDPGYVFGEIENIILSPLEVESGSPFPADWRDTSDWDALLTAPTGQTPIAHKLPVIGTLGEPDRTDIPTSNYRHAYPPKRYNMTVMVDDLSDEAYENLRHLTNVTVRMWYESGGYLFGGEQGIEVDVDSFPVIEEGEDSLHKFHVHMTWRAKEAPARTPSPFVASVSGTTAV